MFYKFGRHIRPLVCKLNNRSLCSKRNIPIIAPWRSRNPYSDFFRAPWRDARDMECHFEEMQRGMERMMGPRSFDANYIRPRETTSRTKVAQVKYDGTGFELKLDVQEFSPSELKVKMAGNKLTVSGKHEQKADEHGYVSREFHRELIIPEDVNLDTLSSSISEEGILTIRANIKGTEKAAEKEIDIQTEQKEKSE